MVPEGRVAFWAYVEAQPEAYGVKMKKVKPKVKPKDGSNPVNTRDVRAAAMKKIVRRRKVQLLTLAD